MCVYYLTSIHNFQIIYNHVVTHLIPHPRADLERAQQASFKPPLYWIPESITSIGKIKVPFFGCFTRFPHHSLQSTVKSLKHRYRRIVVVSRVFLDRLFQVFLLFKLRLPLADWSVLFLFLDGVVDLYVLPPSVGNYQDPSTLKATQPWLPLAVELSIQYNTTESCQNWTDPQEQHPKLKVKWQDGLKK